MTLASSKTLAEMQVVALSSHSAHPLWLVVGYWPGLKMTVAGVLRHRGLTETILHTPMLGVSARASFSRLSDWDDEEVSARTGLDSASAAWPVNESPQSQFCGLAVMRFVSALCLRWLNGYVWCGEVDLNTSWRTRQGRWASGHQGFL